MWVVLLRLVEEDKRFGVDVFRVDEFELVMHLNE